MNKSIYLAIALLVAVPLHAEETMTGHGAHLSSPATNAATEAFNDANMRMIWRLNIPVIRMSILRAA